MRKYQGPKQKKQETNYWDTPKLETDKQAAIYARQSSSNQAKINIQSSAMQTEDLLAQAYRYGWREEDVILYNENKGKNGKFRNASGKLRIDQREGLQALTERIERGEIKTVIVFMLDRLFRDEDGIDSGTFMRICRENGCKILTSSGMIFDLENYYHREQYKNEIRQAAAFLEGIRQRLGGGRDRAARGGTYVGASVPVGYVVDRRPKLEDGSFNPSYKRLAPYEPHAEIVKWLFKRYMELGGDMHGLCREIAAKDFLFPDLPGDFDEKTKKGLRLSKISGGYTITKPGLTVLLSNTVYIGWWVFQDETVSKDNHAAIVDEDVFWYAFDREAKYKIDGTKNPNVKSHNKRFQHKASPVVQALLKDVIESNSGEPVYVNVPGFASEEPALYTIRGGNSTLPTHQTSISVSALDDVFMFKLFEKLDSSESIEHCQKQIEEVLQSIQQETTILEKQISQCDQELLGIEETLVTPGLPESLRVKMGEKYTGILKTKEEIEEKLQKAKEQNKLRADTEEWFGLIGNLACDWHIIPLEKRKTLIKHILVKRAILEPMSPRWLRFTIEWRDPSWGIDVALIGRRDGCKGVWTEEESEIIRQYYPTEDRIALLSRLPRRSWLAIRDRGAKLGIEKRPYRRGDNTIGIPKQLSMSDWEFMQKEGIKVEEMDIDTCVSWLSKSEIPVYIC